MPATPPLLHPAVAEKRSVFCPVDLFEGRAARRWAFSQVIKGLRQTNTSLALLAWGQAALRIRQILQSHLLGNNEQPEDWLSTAAVSGKRETVCPEGLAS